MNRLVAQAFQPAGSADFRVRCTTNGRLESRPNPQARKPAPRTGRGPSSHCPPKLAWHFSSLLVCLLFFRANLVQADELKSGENHAKPIPIATINRSNPLDFNQEILPILKNNCLACHNKTSAKAKLVLETPQDILKGGDSGPAATPQ